jgi:hypothetical protein
MARQKASSASLILTDEVAIILLEYASTRTTKPRRFKTALARGVCRNLKKARAPPLRVLVTSRHRIIDGLV